MKVFLQPLYSQLNPGVGNCPLGCQTECKVVPSLQPPPGCTCPLSSHQAKTCAEVTQGDADIIFNKAATGDGKTLGAFLAGLLDSNFRILGLYPTIELVKDQEKQIKERYCKQFTPAKTKRIDSLYGVELARRGEQAQKGKKFKELWRSLKRNHFILTNPDIFHLVTHFRYYHPANALDLLPNALAQYPHLYVVDEFHIFAEHRESAILNSLLFIRHTRQKKNPLRVLFTSATPKPTFVSKLKDAGFQVEEISGEYDNEYKQGFNRLILRKVELEFIQIEKDSLSWLIEKTSDIQKILEAEHPGRGLIILNSVALVRCAVNQLRTLLRGIEVREISGQVGEDERQKTRDELEKLDKPVLIIATSAVDVGVDFKIHLLIFETIDSATFIQRLGRLGRHDGFSEYKAFALIPSWMRWIWSKINQLENEQKIDRMEFHKKIEDIFDDKKDFKEYHNYWGAIQAHGMLRSLTGDNLKDKYEKKERFWVSQNLRDRITETLRQVYTHFDKRVGYWFKLDQEVRDELLRFRGSSNLQAAVWYEKESRFYTYDLLKLLPDVEIEVINRKTFIHAAQKANHFESEFDERYIQVYLKINKFLDKRASIKLECDALTEELTECTLSVIDGITIQQHPQTQQLTKVLSNKALLTFLVKVDKRSNNSHWTEVGNKLHLATTFGLYRLTADYEDYACAFNQDALLLEALKWKLKRCERSKPYIY